MIDWLFDGWDAVLRTILVGIPAYFFLVVMLRISGKRTLSKMNAFDFIVTVAFGSILATILLSKEVTLAQGIAAFAILIILQFIITWSSVRFDKFSDLVKASPGLLYYRGEFIDESMRKERVNEAEILAAIREEGGLLAEDVVAVVLETDGSFSVISAEGDIHDMPMMRDVESPHRKSGSDQA